MRTLVILGCAIAWAALPALATAQTVIDFEKDAPGAPPAGFTTALTGSEKPGVWVVTEDKTVSTLAVNVNGSVFEVSFNGAKLYEVEDTTFPEAGKIGLWTKADSVIRFDDLRIVTH